MSQLQSAAPNIESLTREMATDRASRIVALRADVIRMRDLATRTQAGFREQLLALAHEIELHVIVLETRLAKPSDP
jgi:hypothetical protein